MSARMLLHTRAGDCGQSTTQGESPSQLIVPRRSIRLAAGPLAQHHRPTGGISPFMASSDALRTPAVFWPSFCNKFGTACS